MKTKIFKHAFLTIFIIFLVACSTKKDTILSRNYHALSTRDNVFYNGQIALNKGVVSIKGSDKQNFWQRLPIERMQIKEDDSPDKSSKNTDLETAEAKATKAIQKHSMYIDGEEKNYQIDEAYMLLGKSRYYDQRFFPALEAFNFILYKYPTSSNINEVKIWREKTNMRLGNDAQVLKNIAKLLADKRLKPQVIADANALMAESLLNLEQKDSAIVKLKIAEKNTRFNAEKSHYRFVLGQLYQELGIKDTALIYFQGVINMNRKADREYVMQAYAKTAQLFDFENGDTIAFIKTFNKLIKDRENRPFKDLLYHEMGNFYNKNNKEIQAEEFYNASLQSNSKNNYLIASNYRNIGNIYFKNTDYFKAAKYYDSTIVKLNPKSREHIHIKKVRKDLDEVIEFETIARATDSILNVLSMSDSKRNSYYEEYIVRLLKVEDAKRLFAEKQKELQKNSDFSNISTPDNPALVDFQKDKIPSKKSAAPPSMKNFTSNQQGANVFYFYNPATVSFGKLDFKKKYGKKALGGNWRLSANTLTETNVVEANVAIKDTANKKEKAEKPEYTTEFYLDKLPKTKKEIDSIAKERNLAYYQLGVIYKEKLKEYKLASAKLEQLLQQNPDEKLILPTLYNLFKIYQITDLSKAEAIKSKISSEYPNSRYAQIINNTNSKTETETEAAEAEYKKWYQLYLDEQFVPIQEKIDGVISQYYGNEILPKFELLKASAVGKLKGLGEYKKAMQFVSQTYPKSDEGKNAKGILTAQIPLLEKMNYTNKDSKNWKILYKIGKQDEKTKKSIEEKYKKYIADEDIFWLTISLNTYNEKENFITIEGLRSKAFANNVVSILKEDKKYKLTEEAIVISHDNYKVLQIRKNVEEYLAIKNPDTTNKKVESNSKIDNTLIPQEKVSIQNTSTSDEDKNNAPPDVLPDEK